MASIGATARILVVDDGSNDKRGIEHVPNMKLAATSSVSVLDLICNCGNQRANAIGIGFVAEHFVDTDYLVVMDSDLEDLPEYIPEMLKAAHEAGGRCIVFAQRSKRSEGLKFRFFYSVYQMIFRVMTGRRIEFGNFSVVPRKLIRPLANVAEIWNHYAAGIIRSKMPFKSIPAHRGKRMFGISKMNMVHLISHAFGGLSVFLDIVSVRALIGAGWFAIFTAVSGTLATSLRMFTHFLVPGWASIFIAVIFVMFLQVFTAVLLLLFFYLSSRLRPAMIPEQEYHKFILDHYYLRKEPQDQA